MKRNIKNIITISIILLACVSIVCTICLAKNKLVTTTSNNETVENGGTPPSMPSGENGGVPSSNSDSSTQGEPPEKPEGESNTNSTNEPPEKPEGESNTNSTNEPPEKPEGESDTNSTSEPPEKPEGDSTSESDSNAPANMGGQMPSGNGEMSNPNNTTTSESTKLTTPYYIALTIESLILSGATMYLVMSGANKKTFKETMATGDKVVIIILSTAILTSGLTIGESMLTNNVILAKNTTSTTENNQNNGATNGGGMNNSIATYSASTEITEDTTITSGEYSSTDADTNAINVSGDIKATISNISVTKTGDSDGGDNTSFYGTNSAIIASSGATLNLSNIEVTTDATGANGVFSYGGSATTSNSSSDGTTINISDSKITTTKDNSGGIMTTGGGIMNATNLTINTAGTSSAAIRTDRGGGTVNVDGGTYTTTGQGSPTIYSTADITVKNATLVSKASEGIVIEGKNSVTIEDVTLTDTNNKLNGQSTTYKNIFLYQSMSGDADTGTSTFTAKNSKITTNKGDTFYITNTTATINLTNNTIVNNDSTGNFLRAQKDSWGNSGSNGGIVTLNMTEQEAEGNIVIDSISTLTMNLSTNSSYTGTINGSNEAKSITLTLDKSSTIKLTGDSYITSLEDADTTYSNIDLNGYTLYVNGVALSK